MNLFGRRPKARTSLDDFATAVGNNMVPQLIRDRMPASVEKCADMYKKLIVTAVDMLATSTQPFDYSYSVFDGGKAHNTSTALIANVINADREMLYVTVMFAAALYHAYANNGTLSVNGTPLKGREVENTVQKGGTLERTAFKKLAPDMSARVVVTIPTEEENESSRWLALRKELSRLTGGRIGRSSRPS